MAQITLTPFPMQAHVSIVTQVSLRRRCERHLKSLGKKAIKRQAVDGAPLIGLARSTQMPTRDPTPWLTKHKRTSCIPRTLPTSWPAPCDLWPDNQKSPRPVIKDAGTYVSTGKGNFHTPKDLGPSKRDEGNQSTSVKTPRTEVWDPAPARSSITKT